nr:hypothetical protein [Ferrimicrobium acidiphilum]
MSVNGTITLSSTNTPVSPITISGTVIGQLFDTAGNTLTTTVNINKTIQWPFQKSITVSESSVFSNTEHVGASNAGSFTYTEQFIAKNASGYIIATSHFTTEQINPTLQLVVMLPLFNVTSMHAIFHCNGATNCSLKIGAYYTYIMIIGIILTVIVALISFSVNQNRPGSNAGSSHSWIMEAMMTIILIVAFPWIYNEVAGLLNYINATLIVGPNVGLPSKSDIYTMASINVQLVWNAAFGGTAGSTSMVTMMGESLLVIAAWFISLFVAIGVWVLGIIRVFIIAVMIVAFPLSLALKNIHFTEKLAGMIEDTLYGVMIATMMSAIILGLTSQLMANNHAQLNSSILVGSADFVAAIALLTALMMPTVFAPLTSTLFQTGMQMAMAAGSMAAMVSMGGASGLVGGVSSVGSGSATNIAGLAAATGKDPQELRGMSTLGRAALAFKHGYGTSTMLAPLQNMGVAAGVGAFGAVGATGGAKLLSKYHKHGDQIAAGHEQYAQGVHAASVRSRFSPLMDPITGVVSGLAAGKELNPTADAGIYSDLGEKNCVIVDPRRTGRITDVDDMKKAQYLKDWSENALTGKGVTNEAVSTGFASNAELDANPQARAVFMEYGDSLHKSVKDIDPTSSYENFRKMANINRFVRHAIRQYRTGNTSGIKAEDYVT